MEKVLFSWDGYIIVTLHVYRYIFWLRSACQTNNTFVGRCVVSFGGADFFGKFLLFVANEMEKLQMYFHNSS